MEGLLDITDRFIEENRSFIDYMIRWKESLPAGDLGAIIAESGGAGKVAVISVDLIEGFCRVGPLASGRVAGIIGPVAEFLKKAHSLGIEKIALTQDSHEEDAEEFGAFPPHCIRGSEEARTVREFTELPFFSTIRIFPKNSIASHLGTELEEWLMKDPIKSVIVVGDCTDLCVYQLAAYVKLLGNIRRCRWNVIVPENLIQTYDLSVTVAEEIGAVPHPGDYFHLTYLYHMMMNGIKVVSRIN